VSVFDFEDHADPTFSIDNIVSWRMRLAAKKQSLINAFEGPYTGHNNQWERWRWLRGGEVREVLMYALDGGEGGEDWNIFDTMAARARRGSQRR
jgi:hypothetical protein